MKEVRKPKRAVYYKDFCQNFRGFEQCGGTLKKRFALYADKKQIWSLWVCKSCGTYWVRLKNKQWKKLYALDYDHFNVFAQVMNVLTGGK